jgi:DMSO/TMAO reductase YedYZ heme-binding membrane subunit
MWIFETINNYNINYSFGLVVTLHEQICIYEKIILSAFMLIGLAFTQAQEISKMQLVYV